MKGFVTNIEEATLANTNFRQVLYTAKHSQLVVMCIPDGEDIGEEVHDVDQFIRLEKGEAQSILNGVERDLTDGSVVIIPAGVRHNIKNTGKGDLKLYTLYAPSHHKDATIHRIKEDALQDEEHFDGVTTDDLSS
ncbi:MAG: cupin domain-containing protein [Patescibacteria group bacterium]